MWLNKFATVAKRNFKNCKNDILNARFKCLRCFT